jgi:RNA polymerase sigma-70 factor (ECF subfamily)
MSGHNRDDVCEPNTETAAEVHGGQDSDARSLNEATDRELVSLVLEGDQSAFEALFERHKFRVGLIAGRFFREHVEDIVQEVFTRAYFALPDFADEREESSLSAWLSRIAFNASYDELRRRARRREHPLSDLSETEAQAIRSLIADPTHLSVESAAISRDLANKLLDRLSAEDRFVLILLDVEGLSVQEISRLTGWSVAKVKIRTFRARTDLRRVLKRFL